MARGSWMARSEEEWLAFRKRRVITWQQAKAVEKHTFFVGDADAAVEVEEYAGMRGIHFPWLIEMIVMGVHHVQIIGRRL